MVLWVTREEDDRLRTVLRLCGVEVLGDLVQGLVPANRLELALAALAHTSQRGLQPVGAIDVLPRGRTLRAQASMRMRSLFRTLDSNDLAVLHEQIQPALRGRVANRADGLSDFDARLRTGDLALFPQCALVHLSSVSLMKPSNIGKCALKRVMGYFCLHAPNRICQLAKESGHAGFCHEIETA